jgi:PPOX class probable F420-dependent enzyme
MRKGLKADDLGDLLELPVLAVLATYRRDGTVLLSPVWHEWRDNSFNVVTESRDGKAGHLRRGPRASIIVCEDGPPNRGLELRATARLSMLEDQTIVRRIATRYLGPEEGKRYEEVGVDDLLIRLGARRTASLGFRRLFRLIQWSKHGTPPCTSLRECLEWSAGLSQAEAIDPSVTSSLCAAKAASTSSFSRAGTSK